MPRSGPNAAHLKTRKASGRRHAEVIALRDQAAKLVALVDHYYAVYRESAALLASTHSCESGAGHSICD